MPKFYEIKGRVAITGNPMSDAKILRQFETELDALSEKFKEAGGTLDMRIATEKEKGDKSTTPGTPPAPEVIVEDSMLESDNPRHRRAAE